MPGDLSNPEFLFPYHYDPKYEPGTNIFETRPLNIDQIIQAISKSVNGHPVSKEQMADTQAFLKSKNMLTRNPGDQEVQETIRGYFSSKNGARKVARSWLTLMEN
jgi:hypothetical protein